MMNKSPRLMIEGDTSILSICELEEVFIYFCECLGLGINKTAGIVFCSDEKIREINRKFRGVDEVTDVISFSAVNDIGLYKENSASDIYIGEIIIDTNYVSPKKKSSGGKKELIKLMLHGFLHLIGYDHLNKAKKKEMLSIEDDLYTKFERKFDCE